MNLEKTEEEIIKITNEELLNFMFEKELNQPNNAMFWFMWNFDENSYV
jgi:hypothetical protein